MAFKGGRSVVVQSGNVTTAGEWEGCDESIALADEGVSVAQSIIPKLGTVELASWREGFAAYRHRSPLAALGGA